MSGDQEDEATGPPPLRWEVELEFIQGLANPLYVHFLAQSQYLESPEFLNYLEYLEYWRKPEHIKYIMYPNCLLMLSLLKEPLFRREISKIEVAQMIADAFFHKWDGPSPTSEQVMKNISDSSDTTAIKVESEEQKPPVETN